MNTTNSKVLSEDQRIGSLDFLRGIAAFGVMLFHYTAITSIQLSDNNVLRSIGAYGHYGVEVFFVLSGFVIPYSMQKRSYRLKSIGKFLLRRTIRIEIPFLTVIVMEIILIYLSSLTPWRTGVSERLDWHGILLHLGYLNGIFEKPWLIPIFWTLAIEFQFYLLIAVLFPLFVSLDWKVRVIPKVVLILLGFILPQPYLFFHYGLFFLVGIIAFQLVSGRIGRLEFVLFGSCIILSMYFQHGPISCLVAILTAAIILSNNFSWTWSSFLGMISYSLYLIHVPFGGRLLVLTQLFVQDEWLQTLLIITYLLMTIMVGWLFYLLVEKPSILLSRKFSFLALSVKSK